MNTSRHKSLSNATRAYFDYQEQEVEI